MGRPGRAARALTGPRRAAWLFAPRPLAYAPGFARTRRRAPVSPIRLDYTCALADQIGPEHGITDAELAAMAEPSARALAAVDARRGKDLRWLDLPYQTEVHDEIQAFASSVQGRFENVVVLGIGGSALGNRALHTALNSPYHNVAPPAGIPRLFVLDNVDPDLVGELDARFDPRKTLYNVISKSGGTAETMSQFLLFRERLVAAMGEEAHREHLVVTTDATQGVMRQIVEREGYRSFVVPEGVGGRFSVLSPVGLLSSALVGIDVKGLLAGAGGRWTSGAAWMRSPRTPRSSTRRSSASSISRRGCRSR